MLVSITCVEDLKARARFKECLDFGEGSGRELLDIIADYSFDNTKKIQCGIQGCRTPHMRGFLALTTDGLETNIGNICGKKHLGESFQVKRASFRKKQADQRNLSLVVDLKQKLNLLKPVLHDLLARSVRVARLKIQLNQTSPELVKNIIGRAKTGKQVIEKTVPMTTPEARRQYSREVGPDRNGKIEPFEDWIARRNPTKTVIAASLSGLLFWQYDLHKMFRQEVLSKAHELDGLDEAALIELSANSHQKFARWGQGLDKKIGDVEQVVKSGEEFFQLKNIESLQFIEPELDRLSRPKVKIAIAAIHRVLAEEDNGLPYKN
ncbi:hypothetical protein [Pseudomonas urmiensis]|uniref:hypothetical protein n=1 Tax=Pseudomonas urmiensis TaxID=2745493 RepID=UPI003D0CB56D